MDFSLCTIFTIARGNPSLGGARGHQGEAAHCLGQAGELPDKPHSIAEDWSKSATIAHYPPVNAAAQEPPKLSPHLTLPPLVKTSSRKDYHSCRAISLVSETMVPPSLLAGAAVSCPLPDQQAEIGT
jgi:hypothetical protein